MDINNAYEHTMAYRSSKSGDSSRGFVVFIDEAHRLTPGHREVLLKKSEKWAGANIVLATTRLDKLGVPGESEEGNPLLSRADVFQFAYPTEAECVVGLINAASTVSLKLDSNVARWIALRHQFSPRRCLGELYRLSSHGPHIVMDAVEEEHGPDVLSSPGSTDGGTNVVDNDPFAPIAE